MRVICQAFVGSPFGAGAPRFVHKLRSAESPGTAGDFGGPELEGEPRSPGHEGYSHDRATHRTRNVSV